MNDTTNKPERYKQLEEFLINNPDDTAVNADDMNQLSKFYKGKPTVYLDHNILDIFVKNKMNGLFHQLKEKFQVVYSDENLREIKRSGGDYSKEFLDVLHSLNAYKLKLEMGLPDFKTTGEGEIIEVTPYTAFDSYVNSGADEHPLAKTSLSLSYKLCGGIGSDTFDEIKNNMIVAFDYTTDILKELPYLYSTSKYVELKELFRKLNDELFSTLKKNYGEGGDEISSVKIRDVLGVGPVQLNNIYSPGVLEQILEIIKDKVLCYASIESVDHLFNIKENPIYPDRKHYNFEKINAIYNILNTIGYYPDKGAYKTMRRFTSASSDMGHASMASFTRILFSRDENCIKKAQAAYEYLAINTNIVNPDNVPINNK